jgi:hypothetical protein
VVHGRADTVVPVGDAARLVARSPRARLLQVDGDHDLREALAPHAATIVDFLSAACAADKSLCDEPSDIAPTTSDPRSVGRDSGNC